jgi:tetratricopeptide (TPR) repeat protein
MTQEPAGERSRRRLESWKEIAAYLNRDVRTTQRWEARLGLPVHRLQHGRPRSVFAYTAEIDAWWDARDQLHSAGPSGGDVSAVRAWWHWPAVMGAATIVALVAAWTSWHSLVLAPAGANSAQPRVAHPIPHGVRESYLKARFNLNKRNATRADREASVLLFEEVIVGDPSFPPAHSGLAMAYQRLGGTLAGGRVAAEAVAKSVSAAERALRLDPDLAEAHVVLAGARRQDWKWAAAEQGYRRALQLDPYNALAYSGYGGLLVWLGRPSEGLALARRGREIDPRSIDQTVNIAWLLYHSREYDEAIREFQTVLAVEPDHSTALWFLGFALTDASRTREAIEVLERAAALQDRNPAVLGVLARAYWRAGRPADARRLITELERRARTGYVPPAAFVHAYAGSPDRNRFFGALERAYREHSNIVGFLKTHPLYDPFRGDPRFVDLVRRVGLS